VASPAVVVRAALAQAQVAVKAAVVVRAVACRQILRRSSKVNSSLEEITSN